MFIYFLFHMALSRDPQANHAQTPTDDLRAPSNGVPPANRWKSVATPLGYRQSVMARRVV